jgi:hypothetical protein
MQHVDNLFILSLITTNANYLSELANETTKDIAEMIQEENYEKALKLTELLIHPLQVLLKLIGEVPEDVRSMLPKDIAPTLQIMLSTLSANAVVLRERALMKDCTAKGGVC